MYFFFFYLYNLVTWTLSLKREFKVLATFACYIAQSVALANLAFLVPQSIGIDSVVYAVRELGAPMNDWVELTGSYPLATFLVSVLIIPYTTTYGLLEHDDVMFVTGFLAWVFVLTYAWLWWVLIVWLVSGTWMLSFMFGVINRSPYLLSLTLGISLLQFCGALLAARFMFLLDRVQEALSLRLADIAPRRRRQDRDEVARISVALLSVQIIERVLLVFAALVYPVNTGLSRRLSEVRFII